MAFIQPPSLRAPFVTAGTGYLLQTSLNFLQQMWVAVQSVQRPSDDVTPTDNGDLVVEATSNTTLTFKLKGDDGVVRSGTVTLT